MFKSFIFIVLFISSFSVSAIEQIYHGPYTSYEAADSACSSSNGGGCSQSSGGYYYLDTDFPTTSLWEEHHFNISLQGCPGGMVSINGACITPEPDPVECGDYDGKSAAQCSCEDNGGGWLELGGVGECMSNTPDECDTSSSDYQGDIDGNPVCSGEANCSSTETYGLVNGEQVCIPADYGPPDCDFGTVAVADNGDGGGFVCAQPSNDSDNASQDTDNDGTPDSTDNDIDGDGIPNSSDDDIDGDGTPNSSDDDYKGASVDNSGVEQGISDLSEKQDDTNRELQNIDLKLKASNRFLDGIDGNIKQLKDYVVEEPSTVDSITGSTATIGETSNRISTAVFDHPFVSSVLTIPTLATNTNCPVFVLPANKFWSEISMTIHCTVLEQQRSFLALLFSGLWTLMAVFVFLKA